MSRVIYVRLAPDQHAQATAAAQAVNASLNEFARQAILEAATRHVVPRPPIAEAACEHVARPTLLAVPEQLDVPPAAGTANEVSRATP